MAELKITFKTTPDPAPKSSSMNRTKPYLNKLPTSPIKSLSKGNKLQQRQTLRKLYSDNYVGTVNEEKEQLIERQLLISDFDDSTKSTDCSNKNSNYFEMRAGAKRM